MSRILLATIGSLGDLFPFLTLAAGLKARGHEVRLAAQEVYRSRAEADGVSFTSLRPDLSPEWAEAMMVSLMDPVEGPEVAYREFVSGPIRESFADLDRAAGDADLLISHPIVLAAPMVAELRGIPWMPATLQPIMYFSTAEISVPSPMPWIGYLARFLRPLAPLQRRTALSYVRRWTEPVATFRAGLGLPPALDPVFGSARQPGPGLALFSPLFAPRQPDWPPETEPTGFLFRGGVEPLPEEIEAFLAAGPPPLVFTLGSSAVHTASQFYPFSLATAGELGLRAILLTGSPGNRAALPSCLPKSVLAVDWAPHGSLFPRAAAIVHQCGIGTCAEALRAGKPMLSVPFAHDQPDNAHRLRRMGVGFVIPAKRYTAKRAARALRRLLGNSHVVLRASEIGKKIRSENGLARACDAVEQAIRHRI